MQLASYYLPVEPHAPGEECRFAENNATLIFQCLANLRNKLPAKQFDYRHNETPPKDIPDSRGIYMFYADFGANHQYPVYIGKTEQGFRNRFEQHARDGVIRKYDDNDGFPIFRFSRKPNLGAVLLAFDDRSPPISYKLAESMFLYPFDFALNRIENGCIRLQINEIIPNSYLFSYKTYFETCFNAMQFETTKVYNAFR